MYRFTKQLHKDTTKEESEKLDYLILLTLKVIQELVVILPSLVAGNTFDILKLLDDCVNTTASHDAESIVRNTSQLSTVVEILSIPGVAGLCRWFGSREDAGKIIGLLLTSADWVAGTNSKRSSLYKLIWLASLDKQDAIKEDSAQCNSYRKAAKLLDIVLKSSSMYIGCGQVDTELRLELSALIYHVQTANDDKQIAILDIVLKIAFHFNAEVSMWAADTAPVEVPKAVARNGRSASISSDHPRENCYKAYLPLSPVLLTMQLLSCSNFSLFAEHLPTPIRRQLTSASTSGTSAESFLSKFGNGFGSSIQVLSFQLYYALLKSSWAPDLYSSSFMGVLHRCGRGGPNGLMTQAGKLTSLLDSSLVVNGKPSNEVMPGSSLTAEIIENFVSNLSILDSSSVEFSTVLFISTLRLNKKLPFTQLQISGLIDCAKSAINKLLSAVGANASLESKLTAFTCASRFLAEMHHSLSATAQSKSKYVQAGSMKAIVDLVALYLIELIRATLCSSQIADSLLYCGIGDIALSPKRHSIVCVPCMQVLCAAASAHSRRLHINGNRSSKAAVSAKSIFTDSLSLWSFLSEKVLKLIEKNGEGADNVFYLGWLLQNFCPQLSELFVNQAFNSRSSFALLIPSLHNVTTVKYNDRASIGFVNNGLALSLNFPNGIVCVVSALDRTAESVLHSGSIACLTDNLYNHMYTAASSGVAHVMEGRGYRMSHNQSSAGIDYPLSQIFGTLGYYCDPIGMAAFLSVGSKKLFSMIADSKENGVSLAANIVTVKRLRAASTAAIASKDAKAGISDMRYQIKEYIQRSLPEGEKLICSFPLQSMIVILTDDVIEQEPVYFDNLSRLPAYPGNVLSDKCRSSALISLLGLVEFVLRKSCSLIKDNSSDEVREIKWADALGNLITYLLKCSRHCQRVVADGRIAGDIGYFEMDLYYVFLQTALTALKTKGVISSIPEKDVHDAESKSAMIWGRVKTELNLMIKACLKFSITDPGNMRFLSALLYLLPKSSFADLSNSQALWNPLVFLELLCSHSMFEECLLNEVMSGKTGKQDANPIVLKTVLQELVVLFQTGIDCSHGDAAEFLQGILLVVMDIYTGTMSQCDRIVYCIIFALDLLLRREKKMEAILPFNFSRIMSSMTKSNFRKISDRRNRKSGRNIIGFGLRTCTEYLNSHLSQPAVYAMLSHFPFSRRMVFTEAQEFIDVSFNSGTLLTIDCEYDGLDNAVNDTWRESTANTVVDMELSDDRYELLISEHLNEKHNTEAFSAEYDPAFWLLVIRHSLRETGERSVRQMANSGALSIVIAALGCHCDVMRAVALSCLHEMYHLATSQAAEKDVTFKERPQIILLLDFIRNAFVTIGESSRVSYLPGLSAIFCSRAAMHLLQTGHELYGRINKYLLSRPFCDTKDVPLFDFLVTAADSSVTVSERLAAIRLLRDGLSSKEDHLTLCRKNAYTKLMLLFPILCGDVRTGHALFDLFDKAMSMHSSGRYLIERCDLLTWMRCVSSLHFGADSAIVHVVDGRGKFNGQSIVGCPVKLLARCVQLLRRTIGAMHALKDVWSIDDLIQYVDTIRQLLASIVADLCSYSGPLPFDYFVQVVCCLWDFSVLCASTGKVISPLNWLGAALFHKFVLVLEDQKQTNESSGKDENKAKPAVQTGSDSQADLVLSVSMLLAFSAQKPSPAVGIVPGEINVMLQHCDITHGLIGASLHYFRLIGSSESGSDPSCMLCVLPIELSRSLIAESLVGFANFSSGVAEIDNQLRSQLNHGINKNCTFSTWKYLQNNEATQRDLPISQMTDDFVLSCCALAILNLVKSVVKIYCILDKGNKDAILEMFSCALRWAVLMESIISVGSVFSKLSASETRHNLNLVGLLCAVVILSHEQIQTTIAVSESTLAALMNTLSNAWYCFAGDVDSVSISVAETTGKVLRPKEHSIEIKKDLCDTIQKLQASIAIDQSLSSELLQTTAARDLSSRTGEMLSVICSLLDRSSSVNESISESLLIGHLHHMDNTCAEMAEMQRLCRSITSELDTQPPLVASGVASLDRTKSVACSLLFPSVRRNHINTSSRDDVLYMDDADVDIVNSNYDRSNCADGESEYSDQSKSGEGVMESEADGFDDGEASIASYETEDVVNNSNEDLSDASDIISEQPNILGDKRKRLLSANGISSVVSGNVTKKQKNTK